MSNRAQRRARTTGKRGAGKATNFVPVDEVLRDDYVNMAIGMLPLEGGGYHLKIENESTGRIIMDGPLTDPDVLKVIDELITEGLSPNQAMSRLLMDRVIPDIPADGQYRGGR